jgi:protoporphyrinogen IX oxidase
MLGMWLVTLHVFCNFLWVGGLAAITFLWSKRAQTGAATGANGYAVHALELYRGPASLGFYGSFVFGVGRLLLDLQTYMHAHWFHGKLTLALVVIALHHILGAHIKRVAGDGNIQTATRGVTLGVAAMVAAFGAAVFAQMKALLVP